MQAMINKSQFIDGILNFIDCYKRLPYEKEDDVSVEVENDEGEIETRTYRASKYIDQHFDTLDSMSDELLKDKVITYESIGEILGLSETVVENAITKKTQTPQREIRRAIHMYFGKDYYPEIGKYAAKCNDCSKKCKYEYWIGVIACPKYKKK